MWLACMKYHPTFGVSGTELEGETLPEQLIDLGRGWEWWPSVLWQVIWTWIVWLPQAHEKPDDTGTNALVVS